MFNYSTEALFNTAYDCYFCSRMRDNRRRYIAIFFLSFFLFTFGFQTLASITRNFRSDIGTVLAGKLIHFSKSATGGNAADDQAPCEEETEDERETEVSPDELLVGFVYHLFKLPLKPNCFLPQRHLFTVLDTHHPLYLVIRTFRI
jgi:hypothetical protein